MGTIWTPAREKLGLELHPKGSAPSSSLSAPVKLMGPLAPTEPALTQEMVVLTEESHHLGLGHSHFSSKQSNTSLNEEHAQCSSCEKNHRMYLQQIATMSLGDRIL